MSSHVSALAYDPDSQTLRVRFHSGAEWAYPDVESGVFQLLRDSGSVGKYMHNVIKPLYGPKAIREK